MDFARLHLWCLMSLAQWYRRAPLDPFFHMFEFVSKLNFSSCVVRVGVEGGGGRGVRIGIRIGLGLGLGLGLI